MAIVEVKVPQLSESVAEATMLQWKKKVGESVAADEILIDIETDKVVLEVPAPVDGVLGEICIKLGEVVTAGMVLAVLLPADAASNALPMQQTQKAAPQTIQTTIPPDSRNATGKPLLAPAARCRSTNSPTARWRCCSALPGISLRRPRRRPASRRRGRETRAAA